jgi:hypothetical protein
MDAVIEVKAFYINGVLHSTACFVGNLAYIPYSDILSTIASHLKATEPTSAKMILRIIEKIGLRNTIMIIDETEKVVSKGGMLKEDQSGFLSVFQTFLALATRKAMITIEEITENLLSDHSSESE